MDLQIHPTSFTNGAFIEVSNYRIETFFKNKTIAMKISYNLHLSWIYKYFTYKLT